MFGGVGERTREGNDLYTEMVDSKVALIYGQMNEPPGARMRVGLSALTIAEYFREELQQDVLLFIDNIFRFVQAGSEVSALLGRLTSAVGYQPTLATEMGSFARDQAGSGNSIRCASSFGTQTCSEWSRRRSFTWIAAGNKGPTDVMYDQREQPKGTKVAETLNPTSNGTQP